MQRMPPPPPRPFQRLSRPTQALCCLLLLWQPFPAHTPQPDIVGVEVIEAGSITPIPGAWVTAPDQALRADAKGMVFIPRQLRHFSVRATGYGRIEVDNAGQSTRNLVVRLPRIEPKALYLSFYGVGNKRLRESALKLISETELNSLVIDIKDDRGHITFRSALPVAKDIGAQRFVTVPDMAGLIASLHAQGIYAIARLVAFKDNLLARSRPGWAARKRDGRLWLDRDGMAWCDPFRQEVWDYNIGLAVEAARYGFDEIQFDYLRFPDEPDILLSRTSTPKTRVVALGRFLAAARRRLAPYNVFVAVDTFGYVLWNEDDTGIGQHLEDMAPQLDYISPMLYPSAFQFGIPGYRDPVAHIHETVMLSLINGQKRTGLPSLRFRPWLQAFRDYAYDRRRFGAREISEQISAAEEFGSDGWMLWNPANVYSADGLKRKAR